MSKLEQYPTVEPARDNQSEKLVRLMDKLHAKEMFGDEESKLAFIGALDFAHFQNLLDTANGLLRDIPLYQRGGDGDSVALVHQNESMARAFGLDETHYPPRQEDKEELLKEMLDLVKRLARERNLQDIALLSAAGINAIHQYMDGNGRTSRLVYFLLTENYTGGEEQVARLKKILGEEGRLYINIDPGPIEYEIEDWIAFHELGIDPDDIKIPHALSTFGAKKSAEYFPENIAVDFKRYILGDTDGYGFFAVFKFLKDNNRLEENLWPFEYGGVLERTDLRVVDLVKHLEPKDYENILETYWQLKKKGVSILLNAIANPEDYTLAPSWRKRETEDATIKESLAKSVDDGYRKSYQEVNVQDISDIWPQRDSLPYSKKVIASEELDQIREINKTLADLAEEDKRERESLGFDFEDIENTFAAQRKLIAIADYEKTKNSEILSPEAEQGVFELWRELHKPLLEISEKYLEKAIAYLDSLGIWKNKFTTRNKSRSLTEAQQELSDSIYYVTEGGQALRIKKYELIKEGLNGVIQPFTEQVFFLGSDGATDNPTEDMNVTEYYSKDFLQVQNPDSKDDVFKSGVRRYDQDGKLTYLNPVDGAVHRGYKVNKVFF